MAGDARVRIWSARRMRWILRAFPPIFFQRIVPGHFSEDFLTARVRVKRSIFTRNLNGTTFGGTIYSAADPVFALMYWQALARRGVATRSWLIAARAQYRKPATTSLALDFHLTESDLDSAEEELRRRGKSVRVHQVEARDEHGVVCAELELVTFLRLLGAQERPAVSAF
ncbi:MAG: YiiD C-terminal domain-containing protein [Planctomycetota bacterium]|nr:YiiD C-terminal domain-containing protein [Planctomycetota bacterium]